MAKNRDEKVKEIVDKIPEYVEKFYFDSDNFKELMKVMSTFHKYSLNNMLLIAAQRPDASLVCGYKAWQKHGRQVVRGARALTIIAPVMKKISKSVDKLDPVTREPILDENGKPVVDVEEIKVARFQAIKVFDVSDTIGKPLPQIGVDELTASVERYDDFMTAIRTVCPVPIRFDEIKSGAKGYYHLEDKEIVIQKGMSELQTIKTALHECVHACHHDRDTMRDQGIEKDKNTIEIEAEGSAMVVCNYFSLDTTEYSIPYLGSYSRSREMEELKASLEMIRRTSGELIDGLTEKLQELTKEHEQVKGIMQENEKEQSSVALRKQEVGNRFGQQRIDHSKPIHVKREEISL